jgi:hypothetical protein
MRSDARGIRMHAEATTQRPSLLLSCLALCGAAIAAEIGRRLLKSSQSKAMSRPTPIPIVTACIATEDGWTGRLFARQMRRNPRVELN